MFGLYAPRRQSFATCTQSNIEHPEAYIVARHLWFFCRQNGGPTPAQALSPLSLLVDQQGPNLALPPAEYGRACS
jgi:hypothetical protein